MSLVCQDCAWQIPMCMTVAKIQSLTMQKKHSLHVRHGCANEGSALAC